MQSEWVKIEIAFWRPVYCYDVKHTAWRMQHAYMLFPAIDPVSVELSKKCVQLKKIRT